ncbi:MAG: GH25 family lysozyme, partial [Bacteroidota bacterium]
MSRRTPILLLLVCGLAMGSVASAYWLIRTGRWTPANPSVAEYPVRGIDVSRHQGRIDWPEVAASGVDFVYMKATEGGDWTDPEFARNWREAGAAGLTRGVYHFFTFCRDGDEQADHALGVLPPEAELPFAVDVEYGGNCQGYESHEAILASLDRFIERVTASTG